MLCNIALSSCSPLPAPRFIPLTASSLTPSYSPASAALADPSVSSGLPRTRRQPGSFDFAPQPARPSQVNSAEALELAEAVELKGLNQSTWLKTST